MAPWLFAAAYAVFDRLQHIWADMAYRGQQLCTWVAEECGWRLAIVERPRRWGWYPVGGRAPAGAGLYGVAKALGGGAHDRLDWPLSPAEQRL